eukprot:16234625-Heterocapsa_arctica.AAC.1
MALVAAILAQAVLARLGRSDMWCARSRPYGSLDDEVASSSDASESSSSSAWAEDSPDISAAELTFWQTSLWRCIPILVATYAGIPVIVVLGYIYVGPNGTATW